MGGTVETKGDINLVKSVFHIGKRRVEPSNLRADIREKVNPLVSLQNRSPVAAGEPKHQFAHSEAVHPNQKWSWLGLS